MNILPFPGNTRPLPFLVHNKKPPTVKALDAAIAAAKAAPTPLESLTHHVTGAIERGEGTAIEGIPAPPTRKNGLAALTWLRENNFIGKQQADFTAHLIRTSEEWEDYAAKMVKIMDMIQYMPHTYQQDGKGVDAIAYLHYFGGSYDAYITEKDKGADTPADRQAQAFGLASFGHDPELGYISLPEILATGRIELDYHFTPTTLRKIKGIPDEPQEPEASEVQTPPPAPSPQPEPPAPPITPSPAPSPEN